MGLFVDTCLSLEVLEQQIHEDGAYFSFVLCSGGSAPLHWFP